MWKLHGSVPGGPRRSSSTATARSSWPSARWQRSSRRTACTSLGRFSSTAAKPSAARLYRPSVASSSERSQRVDIRRPQRHHLAQAVDGERALAVRARERRDVRLLRVALLQLRRHQEELDRARRLEQLLVDQPERVVRVRHRRREPDDLEQHRDGLVPLAVRVVHRRLAEELHRRLVLRRGHRLEVAVGPAAGGRLANGQLAGNCAGDRRLGARRLHRQRVRHLRGHAGRRLHRRQRVRHLRARELTQIAQDCRLAADAAAAVAAAPLHERARHDRPRSVDGRGARRGARGRRRRRRPQRQRCDRRGATPHNTAPTRRRSR